MKENRMENEESILFINTPDLSSLRDPDQARYNLKNSNGNSNDYYQRIQLFTLEWTKNVHPWLEGRIQLVQAYRISRGLSERSFNELAFELLSIGINLREHGLQAKSMPDGVIRLLRKIINLQKRYEKFESLFKIIRGGINGIYLHRQKSDLFNLPAFRKLISWMEIQGCEMQASRFNEWLDYFNYAGGRVTNDLMNTCE
ncbi:MAG: hypothetical protein LWX83_10480, partial [Anaerolineae bacterium]|nr:hypothetical protein [Anaerolineae bacterium]